MESSNTDLPTEPYKLAKYGISLIINNETTKAKELFQEHLDTLQMSAGYAFVLFMDAIMSFEEDKLDLAMSVLHQTEKKCAENIGWLKTVKGKVLGAKSPSIPEKLETQIILADTQVCVAFITFLQQDFRGYVKGGWVMRKAWKIYQHTYSQITDIYKQKFGSFNLPDPTDFEWNANERTSSSYSTESQVSDTEEWILPTPNSTDETQNGDLVDEDDVDTETVARLMSAVCFGYGVLQLGISLLPPSLLKISNFFGFHGSRTAGISNLMYARQGSDMRAPLATLTLLWYHTIVRPYYALDGNNVKAGLEAATLLLHESQDEFRDSAIFLFFKGRSYRLDSNISQALDSFKSAADNSHQREMKLLALHEVGWCHLIKLDYGEAQQVFLKLKNGSRWSKAFYSYLFVICAGSVGKKEIAAIKELYQIYTDSVVKYNQLDSFINRRIKIFPDVDHIATSTSTLFWKLLTYELIYLWNALPSCCSEDINLIINDCEDVAVVAEEPMPGLAKLIQGECYSILGLQDNAIDSLRSCIAARTVSSSKDDTHISAFAEHALGVILLKNPQTKQEGKTMLEHCVEYKDYDFDSKLLVRINAALKAI